MLFRRKKMKTEENCNLVMNKATDIRMLLSNKEEARKFIRETEGKWIYIKFNYQGDNSISGVYTKLKVRNIEELDTIYIYGEEDKDRLTISWNEIMQIEMTPANDEMLIKIPKVDIYIKKYQPIINSINSLPVIDKHIIVTEGKTDWKILKAALAYFNAEGRYLNLDISFLENDGEIEVGNKTLQKIRDYNAIFHNNKLRIFIFDPDVKEIIEEHKDDSKSYKYWKNNVYSFILPIPKFREDTPLISIENYFSDEDIKTIDDQGRRLYMAGEFDKETGRHKEDKEIITLASISDIDNHIIDSRVFRISDMNITRKNAHSYEPKKNVALSKNDFANNILEKRGNFSNVKFDSFTLIFDLIEQIFEEYYKKNDSGEEISKGVYLEQDENGFASMFLRIGLQNEVARELKKSGMISQEIICLDEELRIKLGIEKEGGDYIYVEIPIKYSDKLKDFINRKIINCFNRIYLQVFDESGTQHKSCELFSGEEANILLERAYYKMLKL